MEPHEYELMAGVEDVMWWYRAAHAKLMLLLDDQGRDGSDGPLLDAGCGTGGFLRRLRLHRPELSAFGIDTSTRAIELARQQMTAGLCVGAVESLPFRDDSFAMLTSIDVLCHRTVDPATALSEAYRCLKPGGVLLLNLPAYRWLASAHDIRVHTDRRFSRDKATIMVEAAGFTVRRATYWNMLLLPLTVLHRKLLTNDTQAASDVRLYPPLVDRLFFAVTAVERWWLRRGGSFPCGTSILILAVKP